MSKIIQTGSEGKSRRLKKRTIVIAAVLAAVLGAGAYVLSSPSLRETVATKSEALLDPASGVCSDDKKLVSEYNSVARGIDSDAFKAFHQKVVALPEVADDATCAYMIFQYQARYGTVGDAKKQLAALRTLESQDKKLSRSLDDGLDRQKIYAEIEALEEGNSEVDG